MNQKNICSHQLFYADSRSTVVTWVWDFWLPTGKGAWNSRLNLSSWECGGWKSRCINYGRKWDKLLRSKAGRKYYILLKWNFTLTPWTIVAPVLVEDKMRAVSHVYVCAQVLSIHRLSSPSWTTIFLNRMSAVGIYRKLNNRIAMLCPC